MRKYSQGLGPGPAGVIGKHESQIFCFEMRTNLNLHLSDPIDLNNVGSILVRGITQKAGSFFFFSQETKVFAYNLF